VTPALDQTPSDYAGLVVVAVFKISSKYVGITWSLATRTRRITKLLKCITKTQSEPEPCYKKTQLWSRSHAYENRELRSRSHFIFTTAPQPWFFLRWRVRFPRIINNCSSLSDILTGGYTVVLALWNLPLSAKLCDFRWKSPDIMVTVRLSPGWYSSNVAVAVLVRETLHVCLSISGTVYSDCYQ